MHANDAASSFAGSIPQTYEQHLVPLLFEPYAADLVTRVATRRPSRVLEIAAGTGCVTRHLARTLSPACAIVATDLAEPMLDVAKKVRTARPVEWQGADAQNLPFDDGSFDVVLCQFGVMFFADKPKAHSEVHRVLRPGGAWMFNVWDRLEHNDFAAATAEALAGAFRGDAPSFLPRLPYGYHDKTVIAQDVARGGFTKTPVITTVTTHSRAESPRVPAVAFCQGTPLRGEIEARAAGKLVAATDVVADAIARRFGARDVTGRMQAHVVVVER